MCCSARRTCNNKKDDCRYKNEPDLDLIEDPAWYGIGEEEMWTPPGPAAPAGVYLMKGEEHERRYKKRRR
jgi:hypothetical protein